MGKREIYDVFRNRGISHVGACALIANLQAESALNPCANEGLPQHKWEQYVGEVDSGAISRNDFTYAGCGFGLAQWTFWSRRQELYDYAAESGESIGDEYMQCLFILFELGKYFEGLLQYLKETDDLYTAVKRICEEYENPLIKNTDTRYKYALRVMEEIEDGEVVNDDGDGDAIVMFSIVIINIIKIISRYCGSTFEDTLNGDVVILRILFGTYLNLVATRCIHVAVAIKIIII